MLKQVNQESMVQDGSLYGTSINKVAEVVTNSYEHLLSTYELTNFLIL